MAKPGEGNGVDPDLQLPSPAEIAAAANRIAPYVYRTPVLPCEAIRALTDHTSLVFKCENLQRTGSFKIRGATNAVMLARERNPTNRTFILHSSGNHGAGVALAARELGCTAHIVVPVSAPKVKVASIISFGGVVHPCAATMAGRQNGVDALRRTYPDAATIHPFDHADVIAGQGTLLLELAEQTGGALDAIIVPVGGGGLMSGVSIAARALLPGCKVFGAEPLLADDGARSLAAGGPLPLGHRNGVLPKTAADGLMGVLSPRTYKCFRQNVDKIFTVTEEEMADALRIVLERMKVVIEPSAAVGVAVLLKRFPEIAACKRIAVILCGGNLELDALPTLLGKL